MSDPKDELSARFEERTPSKTDESDDTDGPNHTHDSGYTSDTGATEGMDDSDEAGDTGEPDVTRNRRQMPMYLPENKIESMNRLYDRLDARSKLADEGGIEKHKDFMETVVALALDHEAELADRLGIETDE